MKKNESPVSSRYCVASIVSSSSPWIDVAHGFALMRDRVVLGAVGRDDVDVAFEQIAGAEGHEPLVLDAAPLRIGSVVADGPLPGPLDDAGRCRVGAEERGEIAVERLRPGAAASAATARPARSRSSRSCSRCSRPSRQLAHADAGEQARMPQAPADLQVVPRVGRDCGGPRLARAVATCRLSLGDCLAWRCSSSGLSHRIARLSLRHRQRRLRPALARKQRLDHRGQRQHAAIVEVAAHDLQADRPAVGGEADRAPRPPAGR